MGFYGSRSPFEEKTVPAFDIYRYASTKAFRRMLYQDFHFLEAARIRSGLYEGAYLNVDDFTTKASFKDLILENPNGIVNFSAYTNRATAKGDHEDTSESDDEEAAILMDEANAKNQNELDIRTKTFVTRMSVWPSFAIWARWVLRSKTFEYAMIANICLSSLLMCVEGELNNVFDDQAQLRNFTTFLDAIDFFFLVMFIIEISLVIGKCLVNLAYIDRIFAVKWTDDFREFWNDGWNLFDLVVTSASILTPVFDIIFGGKEDPDLDVFLLVIKYIRIARILRTLNVITRIHKIMLIWSAITRTFKALVFITILMLLFFYIFAIIGIQINDRFSKTHTPQLRYVKHFSSIPYAFLTLFQIFTIDHWFPILVDLMSVENGEVACVFILTWLLLGTFIFKNIFAGVMVNSFQNIRQELADEMSEISNKARFAEYDLMEIDHLEHQILGADVSLNDWELKVFHQLDLIKACNGDFSLSLWPRDTLFHYYIMLEAMARNLAERDELLYILNQSLLYQYNA